MPTATATAEVIVISADDCDNAASFRSESWFELTHGALPEAFNEFFITRIIFAGARHEVIPLCGEDYPALVRVWDNDVDAIYDKL